MGKHKTLSGLFHKLRGKRQPDSDASSLQSTSSIVSTAPNDDERRTLSRDVASANAQQKVTPSQATIVVEGSSTGNTPAESQPVETPPVETPPVEGISAGSISKQLWEQAYGRLVSEEGKLVAVYEKVLSQQLVSSETEIEVTTESSNILADQGFDDKIAHMEQITQRSIERVNRHAKIYEGAEEAQKIIEIFTPIVNTAMSANPVASIAWAGISAALPMIIRPLTTGKSMADGLIYVIQRMNTYFDFVHVLLQKQDEASTVQKDRLRATLTSKIGDLYTTLLRYEMQCICYCYARHPAVKALRAMIALDDFETRLTGLKELEKEVERDIGFFAISNSMDMSSMLGSANTQLNDMSQRLKALSDAQNLARQEKEATIKEEKRKAQNKLTGQFKTMDYQQVKDRVADRVLGTCEWLHGHEKIQAWLQEQASLLVISAGPGCGKSTMAKYLIEDVLPEYDPSAIIAYFFFRESEGHRNVALALSSLLHGIFYESPEVVEELKWDIEKRMPEGSQKWNVSGMKDILSKVCQLRRRPRIICVVDALDECDPKELSTLGDHFLDIIQQSYGDDCPRINFLATTRGYPEIMELFEDKANCMHLSADNAAESDQIQRDINLVLEHKVQRMRNGKLTAERKEMIKNALLDKSLGQRTYLWLDLVFQVLDRNFSNKAKDWERLIHNPPKTVNKAYEDLLRRVNDKERVRLLLDLIVAAERPLSLRELNVALEMHDNEGELLETELELEPDEDFKKWLIYECGFFLRTYGDQVFLIHQTAKDFLLADGSIPTNKEDDDSWYHSTTATQAHRVIAKSCMTYLSTIGRSALHAPYEKFKASVNWFWDNRTVMAVESAGVFVSANTDECDEEFLYTDEEDWQDPQRHWDIKEWLQLKAPKLGFAFLSYSIQFWANHYGISQREQQYLVNNADDNLLQLYLSLFKDDSQSQGPPLWYKLSSPSPDSGPINRLEYSSPVWSEQHVSAALFAMSFDHIQVLLAILKEYQHRPAILKGHCSTLIHHSMCEYSTESFKILLDNGILEKSGEDSFAACLQVALEACDGMKYDEEHKETQVRLIELLLEQGRHHGFINSLLAEGSWGTSINSAAKHMNIDLVELLIKFTPPDADFDELLKEPFLFAIKGANVAMIQSMAEYFVTPDISTISRCFNSTSSQEYEYEQLSWPDRDLLFNKFLDIGLVPSTGSLSHIEEYIRLFYEDGLDKDAECLLRCRMTLVRWMTELIRQGPFEKQDERRIVAIAALCPAESIGSLEHLESDPMALKDIDIMDDSSFLAAYERSLVKMLADANFDLHCAWTALMLPAESKVIWNFAFFLKAGAAVDDGMILMATISPSSFPLTLLFSLQKIDSSVIGYQFSEDHNETLVQNGPWCWGWLYAHRCGRGTLNKCTEGDSLLHIACKVSPLYTVRLLLQFGASTYSRNTLGEFPLHVALLSVDKVLLLLEHGADPNCRDHEDNTPLHWAYFSEDQETNLDSPVCSEEALLVTRELVERKADLTARNSKGDTPLEMMCWHHAPEQLELVLAELEKAAGVLNESRSCLIPVACSYSNQYSTSHPKAYTFIPILLKFGFDINAQDENGWTGLHHICKGADYHEEDLIIQSIMELLSSNADVDLKDSSGWTPLHILASILVKKYYIGKSTTQRAFKVLVDAGAKVDCADNEGQTPLHVLTMSSNCHNIENVLEMVKMLIELGAGASKTDNLGRTPRRILHQNVIRNQGDKDDWEMIDSVVPKNEAGECTCSICRDTDLSAPTN